LDDLARGEAAPRKPVKELAQFCLTAIEEQQPGGPYLLLGYSFGGLVLMEVACQLLERGKPIALLGLVDSYPHRRYWPLRCWIHMILRRGTYHASALMNVPIRKALVRSTRVLQAFVNHLRERRGPTPRQRVHSKVGSPTTVGISGDDIGYSAPYRPRYFDNPLTIFAAAHPTDTPDDPMLVWRKFAKCIEIHVVPGNHVDMLTKYSEALAARISHCLDRAIGPIT
jgi:thioesterase domain-containing protein